MAETGGDEQGGGGSQPIHRRRAVALRYRRNLDIAPRVTASGHGLIAEAIMQKARDAGITLMEDPDLVDLLGRIPVGDAIPPTLYKAVAEVLAYVYRVNRTFPT